MTRRGTGEVYFRKQSLNSVYLKPKFVLGGGAVKGDLVMETMWMRSFSKAMENPAFMTWFMTLLLMWGMNIGWCSSKVREVVMTSRVFTWIAGNKPSNPTIFTSGMASRMKEESRLVAWKKKEQELKEGSAKFGHKISHRLKPSQKLIPGSPETVPEWKGRI